MVANNGKMVVLISPLDNQTQLENSTETSPLNQRLRDNNSDISSSPSSAVTITTSEQSSKQLLHSSSSCQSTKLLLKIIIDIGILGFVGSSVLIFMLIGEPHKRGFFCNDESLMHPFHKSTVKHWMLFLFGAVLPIVIIFITESIRSRANLDEEHHEEVKLFNFTISPWLQNVYRFIGVFLIGTASCQLLTDIGKYSVGRFRPHFLTLCRPVLSDGSNCNDPKNLYRYIEEFTCSNSEITEKLLKDMRMSFPSANSSFSFFTMTFCALYLNARFEWKGSKMLNYFLQFILIAMAWFTSLSRVSDYKHHWSDVLAGALLGFLLAIFVCRIILKLRKRESSILKLPTTKYELCSPSAASQQAQNGV